MKTSDSTKNIGPALLRAQMKIGAVTKAQEAKIPTKSGGSFRYAYADINSVLEICKPALNECGILIMQPPASEEDGQIYVETYLIHAESEEYYMARMPIAVRPGADAQPVGSGITYARRYILLAMLGMMTEDDDGEATKGAQQQQRSTNGNNQQSSEKSGAFDPKESLPQVNTKDTHLAGLLTRDQHLEWIKYHGPLRTDGQAANYDDAARYVLSIGPTDEFDSSKMHAVDRAKVQNFLRKLRTQR